MNHQYLTFQPHSKKQSLPKCFLQSTEVSQSRVNFSNYSLAQSTKNLQPIQNTTKFTSSQLWHPKEMNKNFHDKFYSPKNGHLELQIMEHKKSDLIYGLMRESRIRLQKTMFYGVNIKQKRRRTRFQSQDIKYLQLDESQNEHQGMKLLLEQKTNIEIPVTNKFARKYNIYTKSTKKKLQKLPFFNETLTLLTEL